MTSPLCWTRAPLLLWERFLAKMESHGTFGWELALDEFQEEEEEEEFWNSKGVGKQRWEARGPVGSEWQTSQRNRHSASSDSVSPGQHSTHWLVFLGEKMYDF